MEFEFDKEIDFLLRQTARGETVSTAENPKFAHLDADEISAFAENALPEKIRRNYVLHLADCEECRKNLSNLIRLNDAPESEIIHAEKPAAILSAAMPEIPWYRKLFAVPTLAYAMGALILILASVGVFTVLQNNSRRSEVSQALEKQVGGKGMSSDGDAPTRESFNTSMANAAATNSAMNAAPSNAAAMRNVSSNAMAANSSSPAIAANSNVMMPREASRALPESERAAKPSGALNVPPAPTTADSVAGSSAPPEAQKAENNYQVDEQTQMPKMSPAQNQTVNNQTQIMPDTRNAARAALPSAKLQRRESDGLEDKAKDDKEKSAETTSVGGKSFTRRGNAWVDAAYRGQATTNISRGTNEYKKLDSGLRGIVENLGGTVVIVWKEKAYRIQ